MALFSEDEKIFWFTVFFLEGFLIVFCNILGAFIFARKFHFKPCLLLVNQCFADLLVGMILFYECYKLINDSIGIVMDCPNIQGSMETILFNLPMVASVDSLAIIALERAYAVFRPFRHRILETKHYLRAIIVTWVMCCKTTIIFVISQCKVLSMRLVNILFVLSIIAISFPVTALIFSYVSIYIKLKCFPVFQSSLNSRRQIKLCRTLFSATVASALSLLPMLIMVLYCQDHWGNDLSNCVSDNLYNTTIFILYSNSFINFVIYSWKFPEFS